MKQGKVLLPFLMCICAALAPRANAQSSQYGDAFLETADFTGDGVLDLVVADPDDLGG